MIVEDDPMVASVNETYLSRLPGFCVIAKAADGLQALEKIKALSGSVDLVLLDVFMPKMDGLSFLEHLKNLAPSVSVIMITASQNKESLRTALAHGVADYIIKPFTFERFKAALLTFAERWRLLHEAEDFDQSDLDNIFHRGAPPQQFSKGIEALPPAGFRLLGKNPRFGQCCISARFHSGSCRRRGTLSNFRTQISFLSRRKQPYSG